MLKRFIFFVLFFFIHNAFANVYDYTCHVVDDGGNKKFFNCKISRVFKTQTCKLNISTKEEGLLCYTDSRGSFCSSLDNQRPLIILQSGVRFDLPMSEKTKGGLLYPQITVQIQKDEIAAGIFYNTNSLNPSTGVCLSLFEGSVLTRLEAGFDINNNMSFKYLGFNIRFNCYNLGSNFYLSPEIFTNYYREVCIYDNLNTCEITNRKGFDYSMGVGIFLTFGGNYDAYLTKYKNQ